MANRTADKLAKLNSTKAALKSAINGSGSTVGDVFSAYPTAITSGKSAIAQAITDKGVTTAANATFQQMATNIGQISSNTLLNEIDSIEFCSAITSGLPAYLFVSNCGIIPIVGFSKLLNYSVLTTTNFSFTIDCSSGEVVQVFSEADVIQFHPFDGDISYGSEVFSKENIKFFI